MLHIFRSHILLELIIEIHVADNVYYQLLMCSRILISAILSEQVNEPVCKKRKSETLIVNIYLDF